MADYYYDHTSVIKLFAITVYGILKGRMIPIALLRKILVSIAPLALFYIFRKVAKGPQLPKRKSHPPDFDKSMIVEGEIVKEKK